MSGRGPVTGRGKPVRALLVLLGGWVLVRAALWPVPISLSAVPPQLLAKPGEMISAAIAVPDAPDTSTRTATPWQPAPALPPLVRPVLPEPILRKFDAAQPALPPEAQRPLPVRRIVGHNLLLAAGLSFMELDPALQPYVTGAGPRAQQPAAPPARAFAPAAAERFAAETAASPAPARWQMDAWALWRDNDNAPLVASRPSYGRSQIGAVLRYRLAPSSGHAPQAFLRASAALAGAREQEAALGLSARPLPGVPLRLAAEARLRETARGTDARAAAYAVSEFPPLPLPGGATGEAYVQGGYVTGRDATGFVDGQARITRDLARGDRFRLSAGGGAWGGAQNGARRLDIGPSASLSISAGRINARLAADYRFRVAGEASPASGPALTISAGF